MKQNRYFEQRDIRAVESPYDAAFDLAGRLRGMTHTTRVILFLLVAYFALTTILFVFALLGVLGSVVMLSLFHSEPGSAECLLRKITTPEVGSINRSMARPVVVFPHPLSPTNPSVSPSLITRSIPSTALTWPVTRLKTPVRTGKCFFRFLTSRSTR